MTVCEGKILKGIGGFYYVKTAQGLVECKACGKFRKTASMPYVGDNVELEINGDNKGYITKIHERKNMFIRPPVANIDKLIIVASLSNPEPDFFFIDKLAAIADANNVDVSVCFSKEDLVSGELAKRYARIYEKSGYRVYITSAAEPDGAEQLMHDIRHCATAFSGFSGVGKSSLINKLVGYEKFEVGEVSRKLSRGKHTTRHVEFLEYEDGSYIVDTPGFSVLTLPDNINKDNLKFCFHEFEPYEQMCRFSDCNHEHGGCCAVYDAVQNGEIPESRYLSYKNMYDTVKDKKEWTK